MGRRTARWWVYVLAAAFVACGWLLAVRRPDNAVGWLLLMTALGFSFLPWSVLSTWLLVHGVDAAKWTAGLAEVAFVLLVGGLALLLPLLFPDGRLPSGRRWWRIVFISDIGYMFFASFNLFEPTRITLHGYHAIANPFGLAGQKPLLGVLIGLCVPMLFIGLSAFMALCITTE